ncbi:hypothetical protein [Neobacillus terrae]|uniref:hypothetical protein n=1 Tax=Neobacillus terrae TaxID=3034837 RepID=UPI001408F58A|nr:hypothetical protein [Neobacillus terrae]NHM30220.1 hypothetical protein [Neobacillus terrae]
MKKFLSILFSASLILAVATPVFAADDNNDIAKVLQLIEKTNRDIDQKIEKAMERADDLQENYLTDIRKIEEGDTLVKLNSERDKTLADLEAARNDPTKAEKLNEKLTQISAKICGEQARVNSKIAEIQQDIDAATEQLTLTDGKNADMLQEKIDKLNSRLDERSQKSLDKTNRFTHELEKVIQETYNDTLKMSSETIKKAAEKGVIAEQEWKLVRFADKWVWIDPIRVVKF